MKKFTQIILLSIMTLSCTTNPKDAATFSGKITNIAQNAELRLFNKSGYEKIIEIKEDGTFEDTLKVAAGKYTFQIGQEYGFIYLQNGHQAHIKLDTEQFDNTLMFSGDDADKNNFIIANLLLPQTALPDDIFSKDEAGFDLAFKDLRKSYDSLKMAYPNLTDDFFIEYDEQFTLNQKLYKDYFLSKLELLEKFPKGTPSPLFTDYRNADGSKSSLTDFSGSYVYIDVWATWCGPCIAEIPALELLQNQFKDKNVVFLSVSIDQEKDFEKWLKMIEDKNLAGNQVIADNAWQSEFVKAYLIDGIPRFILLDPENKIVSADAPRPSDPTIIKMLNELLKAS